MNEKPRQTTVSEAATDGHPCPRECPAFLGIADDLRHVDHRHYLCQVRRCSVMNAYSISVLILRGVVLGIVVWVLAKLGGVLVRAAKVRAAAAALGFTVRGYVQEPTKDTVPVRQLSPRRICLRISAKSHVGLVLGDQAYERGAGANRITDAEAGVGYVFGEGIREPLCVRAGWVLDEMIKHLETFVTNLVEHETAVLPLPTKPTDPNGLSQGGAA
jgi:hypothetical protein